MTDQDDQNHRTEPRPLVHGRRTRVVVALIGFLLSMGVPAVVLSAGPVPTVDGHAVGPLADPAGLGVTGALSGDPLTGASVPGDGAPTTGIPTTGLPGDAMAVDSAGAAQQPGIPTPPNLPDGPLGIPGAVLDAYQFAQRTLAAMRPGCHLSWAVLAGIGRIESNHASDGRVDAFGNTLGPILGPRLDGSPGMAAIPDTDHGQLDGDTVWDRAVGPMQFIPASWRAYGVDGNGDGVANPNNIYDSTITTGLYLCAGGSDLADPAQLQAAVFRYNHSATYVDIVLRWAQAYLTGVVPMPSAPGLVPPGVNGNGGRLIVPDPAPSAAAAAAAVVQLAPLAAPTAPTSTPSPPPLASMTTAPTTAPPPTTPSPSPPPPTATTAASPPRTEPSPSPSSTATMTPTSPMPSPPAMITTTSPAADPSPRPTGP
ncbi:MAG: lytic murein transglycosylase [Actinomycetota bacterium]|nr:lytic murein transglycosylase [Actinomycetota bacterium]